MKLSQDILYTRLNDIIPSAYVYREDLPLEVSRPVFFSATTNCNNRAVIITPQELETLQDFGCAITHAVFFCTAPVTAVPRIEGCSVLSPLIATDLAQLSNALQSIFDLFEAWIDELSGICLQTGDYQDLVASTESVAYDPLCVVDKDLRYVAYCQKSVEHGLVEEYVSCDKRITREVFSAIITDVQFAKLYEERSPFVCTVGGVETVSLNIFYRDAFIGRVIVGCRTHDEDTVNYYRALLSKLSPFADKLYEKFKTIMQDQGFYGSVRQLVRKSLEGKHISSAIWSSALADGDWKIGDTLLLVHLRPDLRYDKNVYWKYVSEEIEISWSGCVTLDYQDDLILFVNLTRFMSPKGEDFGQALSYFLRDNLLTAGLSREFSQYQDLQQAFTQTDIALKFGLMRMPMHWYHRYDNYALDYLLSLCTTQLSAEQISSKKLLELRRHDTERNTEYYKTLSVYFDCSYNAMEAAKQLCIHRSTFIARMSRIKDLVNIDFESPDELLYLQISLRLLG